MLPTTRVTLPARIQSIGHRLLPVLVVLRIAAHAVFVPAYEGPDETLHLSRVLDFANRPFRVALESREVDRSVTAGIRLRPCNPGMSRLIGCPAFGTVPASFNLLHPLNVASSGPFARNPESNQPPLFYAMAGLLIRGVRAVFPGSLEGPEPCLLFVRLICVALVGIGVWGLTRLEPFRRSPLRGAVALSLLLLPGAAESLGRCSNDASVFAWCSLALVGLESSSSPFLLVPLLAVGPLLKPTALPVVVFVAAALWTQNRRKTAIGAALASLLLFPMQLLRGWKWGGTHELNRPLPALNENLLTTFVGLARSSYTFVKTTFWLGGWTFFRAPHALVLGFAALVAGAAVLARVRRNPTRVIPHLLGLSTALIGFLAFAFANRLFFGGWGGVGGWYFWTWLPWLAVAVYDILEFPREASGWLLASIVVFVCVANLVYYSMAFRLYR